MAARQQDVGRLDVAVHHTGRVGVVEGGGDLAADRDDLVEAHSIPGAGQPLSQRVRLDEWHRVPGYVARDTRVEQRENVGVVEAGRDTNLAEEPLRAERRHERRIEDLDGDLAIALEIAGEIDGGHPAATELALDPEAVVQGSY
jgi:hypothetical protein